MLTLSEPINILFLTSQLAAVNVLPVNGYYPSCTRNGQINIILRLWNKNSKRQYLVKS